MLYDAHGRPVEEALGKSVRPGRAVWTDASDGYDTDESRALTPETVDEVLTAANSGDIERQAKLAVEIEEKNWDISQAVQVRRLAVAGLEWSVEPTEDDESPLAAEIAEAAEAMLRRPCWETRGDLESFDQALRYGLQGALLPGFAVVELVWSQGGAELLGYQEIEPRHFTFQDAAGLPCSYPRLRTTDAPAGMDLPAGKFAVHFLRGRPGARCRGGLIRPLAWLHCFARVNLGDLLTFIERYGMPFLVTKVSADAWQTERTKLKALVQSFGPAGGAVFTENVQTELLQASNNTGDVYFRLLEYCADAVTKVVLGQLASSAEPGGLSKGDAQSKVRQDLVEADARALESTVRTQILRPWTMWNYGAEAPVPRLHIASEPPEDTKATAETAASLYNAGLEWDEEEASERMGMKLVRKAPAPAPDFGQGVGGALPRAPAGERVPPRPPKQGAPAAESADAEAPAAAAPGAGPGTAKKGKKVDEDAAALEDAPEASAALADFLQGQGLKRWFGPLQAAIEAAVGEPDAEAFRRKVMALADDLPGLLQQMDSSEFEQLLEGEIYLAAAAGKAGEAERLAAKEGKR